MNEPNSTEADPELAGPLPRAFGNFTLLKSLARGARGEVFAALRPVEIERFCALKILSTETTRRPDFVTGLRNEATRIVRRIHGNLVQLYDVGLVDQRLFFVSELVDGVDLAAMQAELARRRQPFPVDVAVFVAMELAAALSYLRRLAVRNGEATPLPGGLSPRAVLLSLDGEVKLLHYGAMMASLPLREALTPPSGLGARAGLTASSATDVYLLGALLRSLVGATPAPGKTPPPLPASGRPTEPPPSLSRVIDRALGSDPTQRFADVDELRMALATVLRALRPAGAPTPALGDLLRQAAPRALVDRAALAAVAKSYDPRRGASPQPGRPSR